METSKACQDTDIPAKTLRKNADILADILLANAKDSVRKSNFSSSLKNANITPAFTKSDRNYKDNYRLVIIFPNMSKIFERFIFRQLCSFMLEFLSKCQRGFRKSYSTQYCHSVHFWQICLKYSTVFLTNFGLLNVMLMDLA